MIGKKFMGRLLTVVAIGTTSSAASAAVCDTEPLSVFPLFPQQVSNPVNCAGQSSQLENCESVELSCSSGQVAEVCACTDLGGFRTVVADLIEGDGKVQIFGVNSSGGLQCLAQDTDPSSSLGVDRCGTSDTVSSWGARLFD